MTADVIDREAGDSGKGFRLQLIRAIKLMLDTIQLNTNTIFFTAVENREDVSHTTIANGEVVNYFEEDKNYDSSGNFTIFSPPVINTLVSFFDIYISQFNSSDKVYLGFYTTRKFGKERKNNLKDGSEITLPQLPILEIIQSSQKIPEDTLLLVKQILLEEYTIQYTNISKSGNLDILQNLDAKKFEEFLRKISWHFGQEDENALKATVLKEIEKSPLHNNMHIGKENIIFSLLMEKLGERQNSKDLVEKLVHSSDVKLIFKEAESQIPDASIDPMWDKIIEKGNEITDKRNLKEKILSVINEFPDRRINHFARNAADSKHEEKNIDKSFLSLKYRVYMACEEYFSDEKYIPPAKSSDLDGIITNLVSNAVSDIAKLKTDYTYTISNEKTITNIIWNLFDSCYLAFDEYNNG